jgi:thiamine transporter
VRKITSQEIAEIGIIAAISFLLSYLPLDFFNKGLDLSVGLVPLAIFSVRRGVRASFSASIVWGLLALIFRGLPGAVSPIQVILDYPVAFAMAGFFGLYSRVIRSQLNKGITPKLSLKVIQLAFIGVFPRWFFHFLAGWFFWGSYLPKGTSPVMNSLVLNGTSFIANFVMVSILLVIIIHIAPNLFRAPR